MPSRYDLIKICALVQKWFDGDDNKIWFAPKRKSYGAVGLVFNKDDSAAQEIIATGLTKLRAENFYQQRYLSGRDCVADVYGLEDFLGHNWYVKFFLYDDHDDEYVAIVSFHPLDEVMKCETGRILDITYRGDRPWKSN